MTAIEQHFHVVLVIVLRNTVLTVWSMNDGSSVMLFRVILTTYKNAF